MIIWAFIIVVMAILSYLVDVGAVSFLRDLRVPFLGASTMSVVLLLCGLGMMGRIHHMVSKGAVEKLRERIKELEEKLKEKSSGEN